MSIRIEPAELRFPFALNTATVQKLRILAVGASTTFKIKTTNPKRYSVRPNLGIAWMGAAAEVTVQLGAFKELPGDLAKCKDKFQVLSLVLSDEHCQQLEALGPEERRATEPGPSPNPCPARGLTRARGASACPTLAERTRTGAARHAQRAVGGGGGAGGGGDQQGALLLLAALDPAVPHPGGE